MPEDMPVDPACVPDAGAMLPGDAPGAGEAGAACGAPVGAGEEDETWAIATPAVKQSAAEASKSERMKNLLNKLQIAADGAGFSARSRPRTWSSAPAEQVF
jgi:hypothetical protein